MSEQEMVDERYGDGEVERRLGAYAGARLSPDSWASLRMRAQVIERGRAALDARSARRRPFARLGLILRRGVLVGLVAILAVGTGGTAALAASPGGPLYGARLWVETATLPAGGQARTDAQAGQLDERVDEATDAADAGNTRAVGAALAAYDTEIAAAVADADGDPSKLGHLRAVIGKHIAVLQALEKKNATAAAAIDAAIARGQAALAAIDARVKDHPQQSDHPGQSNHPDKSDHQGGGQHTP
jgi:hypothetical protein